MEQINKILYAKEILFNKKAKIVNLLHSIVFFLLQIEDHLLKQIQFFYSPNDF